MIINFKEIPPANKGEGEQDRFEQFACDFLETIGFKIIRRPDRGPDGKKDLIVCDVRSGVGGETTVNLLVSCKHKAHSGVAVSDIDEPDIYDRVLKHNCDGFIGFYSTILGSTLSDKLYLLRDRFESITFDSTRIERELLLSHQKERILASYFPNSYIEYRQNLLSANLNQVDRNIHLMQTLTEEDVLRITKTAIILLEIDKIQEEYWDNSWNTRKKVLAKLYKFSDHSNERIAKSLFLFLESVAQLATAKNPSDIASLIYSFVLTFFSPACNEDKSLIENGKQCILIGYILAYDAFIHSNNFNVAQYGLSILKFIYREAKINGLQVLVESVLNQYEELEQTLDRPERNNLTLAKEFVQIYKQDLETLDLAFPILPSHLFILTLNKEGL